MFKILEVKTLEKPSDKDLQRVTLVNEYMPIVNSRMKARYESVMKVLKPEMTYRLVDGDEDTGVPDGFYNLLDRRTGEREGRAETRGKDIKITEGESLDGRTGEREGRAEARSIDKKITEVEDFDGRTGEDGTPRQASGTRNKSYAEERGKVVSGRVAAAQGPGTVDEWRGAAEGVAVNVSAIVGENGMGKSSLIELMIRLLNNAAFALRKGRQVDQHYRPRFVRNIYAALVFEAEGSRYELRQRDVKMVFIDQNDGSVIWRYDFMLRNEPHGGIISHAGDEADGAQCREWMEMLFYTVVVNYSAYSYNARDYRPEWTDDDELDEGEDREKRDVDDACWLNGIFHKNDGYQLPLVLNPFRKEGNIDYNSEQDLLKTRLFLLAMADGSPMERMFQGKKPFSFVFDTNMEYTPRGSGWFASRRVFEVMTALGLRRIHPDDQQRVVAMIGESIMRQWSRMTGIDLMKLGEERGTSDYRRTMNYVVYKTIKICLVYWKFARFRGVFESMIGMTGENLETGLREYVMELADDSTHITLKLRRALAFLIFNHYGEGKVLRHKSVNPYEISLKEFHDIIADRIDRQVMIIRDLRRDYPVEDAEQGKFYGHEWQTDELLPAPSFNVDLMLKDDKGAYIRFNTLSSGERQMVNSVSTMLYHVYNIRSVWDNEDEKSPRARYKYINLIFDEIELYFHPKFQTQLVKMLLDGLGAMKLEGKIKGVNIIMSTHSPFILSDIPKANTLLLKNGEPVEVGEMKETFCANVYDILSNGFFMTQFVGDFAARKVDGLVERLEREREGREKLEKREGAERMRREIELIGDDFVRETLKRKYAERFGEEDELLREREALIRRLNDIDNKLRER